MIQIFQRALTTVRVRLDLWYKSEGLAQHLITFLLSIPLIIYLLQSYRRYETTVMPHKTRYVLTFPSWYQKISFGTAFVPLTTQVKLTIFPIRT